MDTRRRWSDAERLRIVAEAEEPGACFSRVARRDEVSRGLLWNWRAQVRRGEPRPEPPAVFVPVRVVDAPSPAAAPPAREAVAAPMPAPVPRAPAADALERHVTAGAVLHADDTPAPVLAPGTGETKTGRLWAYARDGRAWAGDAPPAVLYRYAPDREGEHPRGHLAGFRGVPQADGYAGFAGPYAGEVAEAACRARARRKPFDVRAAGHSPPATEAVRRIASPYEVERDIAGRPPDERARVRQARAGPAPEGLHAWSTATLARPPGRGDFAGAIRHALSRWAELARHRDDGRVAIDDNAAERAVRPPVSGRENRPFAGSDRGGTRAAAIASSPETAEPNGIDPEAHLRHVLGAVADHPVGRVAELPPWTVPDLAARLDRTGDL